MSPLERNICLDRTKFRFESPTASAQGVEAVLLIHKLTLTGIGYSKPPVEPHLLRAPRLPEKGAAYSRVTATGKNAPMVCLQPACPAGLGSCAFRAALHKQFLRKGLCSDVVSMEVSFCDVIHDSRRLKEHRLCFDAVPEGFCEPVSICTNLR